jgi:aspartyl-tRNA(Asn)/glutamyl-tRNA(Gln) amidotransferase subunit A
VIRHFYTRDMQADPEMAAGIEAAVVQLADLGAEIREIDIAPLATYAACYRPIMGSETFAIHEKWMKERPQDYGARTRGRIMAGAFIRGADYVNATRVRRKLVDAFNAVFKDIDVAVTANSLDPACRIDDSKALELASLRQARWPFNITGNPAMSLPAGFSKARLPLAIQIVGAPFSEALVYRVAHAYEQAATWSRERPVLL